MENKTVFKRDEILGYEINSGIPLLLTREELKLAQKISEREKEKFTSTIKVSSFDYTKGFIQHNRKQKITFNYDFKNLANLVTHTLDEGNVPTVNIDIKTVLRLMDKVSGLKDFDNLNFSSDNPEDIIKGSRYGSLAELIEDIKKTGDFCEEKMQKLRQYKKPVKDFSGLDEEDKKWLNEPKVASKEREKLRELNLEDMIHSNRPSLEYSAKKILYTASRLTKDVLYGIEVAARKSMNYLSRQGDKISEKFEKIFPEEYPVFILGGNKKKLQVLLTLYAIHKIKNDPSYMENMDKQNLEDPLKQAIINEVIIPGVTKKEIHLDEKGNLKDKSLGYCSRFFDLCMDDYFRCVEKTLEIVDNVDKIFFENFKAYMSQRMPVVEKHSYKEVFRDFFVKGINNAPEPLHSLFIGKNSLNNKIFTKERVQSIRRGCETIYGEMKKGYEEGLKLKGKENARN